MATTQIIIRSRGTAAGWTIARWLSLAAVALILGGMVYAPGIALKLLWYVIVPVLPAVFFLNPAIWRGLCPLATLNEAGNRLGNPRAPSARLLAALGVGGLALFHLMVPARHFLFNLNGPALAAAVGTVALLAVALGARFPVRSAFCNTLCPVLPVELLYGQAPLVRMERGRCDRCTACTPRGCLDLAGPKSIPQLLGATRHSARWLVTPYGAFFAALPGFIIGYNRVADGPVSDAVAIYGHTLGWSLASFLAVALAVLVIRASARPVLALLAATSGGLYYWYAGPTIVNQLHAAAWLGPAIQISGVGLVMVWLVRALRRHSHRSNPEVP